MFCEDDKPDGSPGPCSMRRVLAFASFLAGLACSILTLILVKPIDTWFVFIPSIAFVVAMLLLLFFTTWSDVSMVIKTVREKESAADVG
jgi:hypothetical protein